MLARAAQALTQVERELSAERAVALARIAEALEAQLARLAEAQAALRAAGSGQRGPLTAAYLSRRTEALRWRWYLEVQREAVGLVGHDDLDRFYPIPPAPACLP
jgi:hypothetical protein